MAKNGRFGLSLRILMVLAAAEEGTMQTSAEIAKQLAESAVMVRRCFLLLHKKGLIEQRKGPNGGAKLKLPAKQIGIGDIYSASEGEWLAHDEPAIAGLLKRVREDGVQAMNETTLAQVLKRIRKNAPDAKAGGDASHNKKATA
jgi:DNA-binding IscR family transcriptional regulator